MDSQTKNILNKDLILRERLAIERTAMANDTTLLAFIRTALYFTIAGMSVNRLLNLSYGWWVEIVFWLIALFILLSGVVRYRNQKKSLKDSEKHIAEDSAGSRKAGAERPGNGHDGQAAANAAGEKQPMNKTSERILKTHRDTGRHPLTRP